MSHKPYPRRYQKLKKSDLKLLEEKYHISDSSAVDCLCLYFLELHAREFTSGRNTGFSELYLEFKGRFGELCDVSHISLDQFHFYFVMETNSRFYLLEQQSYDKIRKVIAGFEEKMNEGTELTPEEEKSFKRFKSHLKSTFERLNVFGTAVARMSDGALNRSSREKNAKY